MVIAAALVGGFLAWKVIEQKQAEEQQAYMEAMELAKLQQQAKKEETEKADSMVHSRCDRSSSDDPGSRHRGARLALSAQLCRRSHAVCGGGGADPGNVAGAAL